MKNRPRPKAKPKTRQPRPLPKPRTFQLAWHYKSTCKQLALMLRSTLPYGLMPEGRGFWQDVERRLMDYGVQNKKHFAFSDHKAFGKTFLAFRDQDTPRHVLRKLGPACIAKIDLNKAHVIENFLCDALCWETSGEGNHFWDTLSFFFNRLALIKVWRKEIVPHDSVLALTA